MDSKIGTPGKSLPSPFFGYCEEASLLSKEYYIPCGKKSTKAVYHKRDDTTYRMCVACADHNLKNRGGELLNNEENINNTAQNTSDETNEPGVALALIENRSVLDCFSDRGLDPIIEKIKAEVKAHKPDISTPAGRKAIASLARKVASAKVALDDEGKQLVAKLKAQTGGIDAERKRMREELDALRDDVRKPLTEWEDRDKNRIIDHERCLAELNSLKVFTQAVTSTVAKERLPLLTNYLNRDWQEFNDRFKDGYRDVKDFLDQTIAQLEKQESNELELKRLREEDFQRKQKERDDQIAAQAAEAARLEAEAKAKKEADEAAALAKNESDRIAKEKKKAEDEAKAQRERAEKAEQEKKDAVAKAEKDRVEAAALAEKNRLSAEKKSKADQEAAVEAERQRTEKARQAEAEATAKREADKKHKMKIINQASIALLLSGLVKHEGESNAIITMIAEDKIPNVKVIF